MASGRDRRLYMGVDIAEGSPQSRQRPLYAVVIVDEDGRIVASQQSVPLSRVIRLAWEYRPAKLAVDNIFELASSRRELERILGMFPPDTEIVQVTLEDRGVARKLREAAREAGLDVGRGKLSPGKAAYLAAVLASLGEGVPVRQVDEKTIITVTRGRSPGRGGQSQRRLQRRVRASVHIAAMRIKEALDKAGLDYDFSYRESVGGLESATFTVYAPRTKLYGVVRPHRGQDYIVSVKPVYKTRLSIPSGEQPSRPIIVGVDPGITTGLAILDLSGRVLYLASGKDLDRGRILEIASSLGRPVIVAVDVSSPPEAARKIAAQLGASLYTPPEDLSTMEKRELAARAYGGKPPVDSHQRDALAAAYRAFQALRRKMEQVEREVGRLGLDIDADTVKEAVARGLTIAQALEEAIEERLQSWRSEERAEPRPRRPRPAADVENLVSRIEALTAENRALAERIERLTRELEEARREAERAKREARAELMRDPELRALQDRVRVLEEEIRRLRGELESREEEARRLLEALLRVARGEAVVARRIPSLTVRSLRRSEDQYGALLPGEIIYVDTGGVVEEEAVRILAEAGVLGVVYPGPEPGAARRLLVPFIRPESLPGGVSWVAGVPLLSPDAREAFEEARRRLEEEARSRVSLESIIEEYRRMRREAWEKRRRRRD